MKQLSQYINESIEKGELEFKVNMWLRARPGEQDLWDNACKSWKETRQADDSAIQKFMDHTDVRAFVDFLNGSVNDNVNLDGFDVVKKTIMNLY